MRIKISIIVSTLFLGSCAFNQKLSLFDNCQFPINSPYPGGVLSVDIKNIDLSNPLKIKAFQYDIVCNGIELSSGAIRNHIPELMYKLFSVAGYDKKTVDDKFSGMINALS